MTDGSILYEKKYDHSTSNPCNEGCRHPRVDVKSVKNGHFATLSLKKTYSMTICTENVNTDISKPGC